MKSDEICLRMIATCKENDRSYNNTEYDQDDIQKNEEYFEEYEDDIPEDTPELDDYERIKIRELQKFNQELNKLKDRYPLYDFTGVKEGERIENIELDAELFTDYLLYD